MLNKISKHGRVALFGCAVAAVSSTGCRSASPMNMFGWNREPSAEALAGSGPTVTYPVPPSKTAKPQAIESIAAGTTPPTSGSRQPSSQVASMGSDLNIDMGSPESKPSAPTTGTSSVNLAAARANGFYGQSKPSSYTTPSTGSNRGMPGTSTPGGSLAGGMSGAGRSGLTPNATTSGRTVAPSYTMPSSGSSMAIDGAARSNPLAGVGTASATTPSKTGGGFSLPTGLSSYGGSPTGDRASSSTPSATQAAASIATAYPTTDSKDSSDNASSSSSAPSYSPGSSYAPGSTSSGGYPSGGYAPSRGTNSIYR